MDDRFLHELKREPRPAFARALRERLRQNETSAPLRRPSLTPLLAPAFAMAAVVGLFLFPSVRASAQAFLDLFRIRTFTAVQVDPERFKKLESDGVKIEAMIGDHAKQVKDPGPPQFMASAQLAGAAAGFVPRVPTTLPAGLVADTVTMRGEGQVRVTGDAAKLRALLEALDIRDLRVPDALTGQVIDIRLPAAVEQRFVNESRRAVLFQSRSPEISLPTGVNLADLGEIGLRILGLDASEARRVAQRIDWRSTMLLPIPSTAASFREVDVRGQKALMITSTFTNKEGRQRERTLLLWSDGDMVFALSGNVSEVDLTQMANSIL